MLTRPEFRAAAAAALALCLNAAHAADAPPRLILQITVDQLRGDLPQRYLKHMGQGGFRLLMDKGVWYTEAHHNHANTETVVGHATLATGADPAVHGMIGNVWLDRSSGKLTYNVEDADYRILSAGAGVDKANEVDPTQKVAASDGRSPRRILTSTFSDELAKRTATQGGKIFGVSVKDRAAVTLAGHKGKAFWFSKSSGEFVTSNYYYDTYPEWVKQWNARKLPVAYAGKSWELLNDKSTYEFGDADDRMWETNLPGYGRVFPHPYGKATSKLFTTLLTLSPAGDDLTLDFTKALIDAEQLGKDKTTDYLSVSFSSTDYVGHMFGPSSLEAEDNLLRLDRTLADLLAYVDQRVGLKNTLIVLSADHGTPEVPAYLKTLGIDAGYVTPNLWETHPGILALKDRFGLGKELIKSYFHPYVYLNRPLIAEKGLKLDEVARAVAEQLRTMDGVAYAVPVSELRDLSKLGALGKAPVMKLLQANYNPERSGDIAVVHQPNYFINDFDGLMVAAVHGSPWRYDTHVPVIFFGHGLKPQHVQRPIETVDVAVTLSAAAGAAKPSGARGVVLPEVVAPHPTH